MSPRLLVLRAILAALLIHLSVEAAAQTQTPPTPPDQAPTETPAMMHAAGTFEVKLTAQPLADAAEGSLRGRMSLDKQFHGDLEATSKGEMLTGATSVKASAGYVAIEEVSGTLHGRSGTFILQHSGTMTRGVPSLTITVVPDSGTGQLVGIAGKMAIIIADGKHSYDFEYTLPAEPPGGG